MTLRTAVDEAKGYLGLKFKGITLVVEPANTCCCRCPSCPVSVFGPRAGEMMTPGLFTAILDKTEREAGSVRVCHLYFKGEPTLNKQLPELVAELTRRKIPSSVSTVLQTVKCDLRDLIEARPSEFRVSFPGLNFIEKYQKGSPRRFMENLRFAATLPRYPETRWVMLYQVYRDNQGQDLESAKSLAKMYGFDFIPLPAIYMVSEHMIDKSYTETDKALIADLIETPEESVARMDTSSRWCACWKQLTIDAKGDVFVCTLLYDEKYNLGPFLDKPLSYFQKAMRHEACGPCMESGNHVYQACYDEFITHKDPVTSANRKRLK